MAKTWDELDYWQKEDRLLTMADAYGIDPNDYSKTERESGAYGKKGDWDDFQAAVLNAGQNHYDTREALKYGKESGDKRFEDLGDGISNIGELSNVHKALQKTHKKALDNGGQFSSANDFANVAKYLHNNFQESVAEKYGRTDESDEEEDTTPPTTVEVANTPSDFWTNVVEDPYFDRYGEVSPYSKSNNDAATAFKNKYVTDITEGLNIDERQSLNLKNAMNAVGNSEIKQGHTNYLSKFHDDDD